MKTHEKGISKWREPLGTATVIAWSLLLGPVGAALILGASCAFLSDRPQAGVACAMVAALPVALGAVWSALTCAGLMMARDRLVADRVVGARGSIKEAVLFPK